MPKDPELAQEWKNSRIREISSSLKNFKGSSVQYAYDKQDQLYSVKVDLRGKPYILTLKVGPTSMDMMLTDVDGKVLEHASQSGSLVRFKKNS
jgi:hypothetical protein